MSQSEKGLIELHKKSLQDLYQLTLGGYNNNIWPLFGSANQLLAALVLIALVSNIAGGQVTFLVDGLQFIVAILLMVLGVLVAFSCLKKLFTAKKQEA